VSVKFEILSIVLLEDLPFTDLMPKIEKALNLKLPYENHKGRLIGKCVIGDYEYSLIDKIDELGEFLCDETHTLDLRVNFKEPFDYKKLEEEFFIKLKEGNISWEKGVWTSLHIFDETRYVYKSKR